ncbi:hypothetical protein CKQ53_14775 [Lonsdalea britannica]|uniref:Uncharacterized protein n=1 Tax=Lonsdalea britannica TaxID=1082704 RepID=A0AAD0SIS9_9GAMM|nr:hypothetical protein [Lonsdalea britannica]AXW88105.1 hypothetical protein CKQ53_14775 [Lonsdalea britannica]
MKNINIISLKTIAVFALFFINISAAKTSILSDEQVKKAIIQDSINKYPGNCPCPYHSAKNGSRCGGRSAWSRAGGYSPICYDSDVSNEMIQKWRRQH